MRELRLRESPGRPTGSWAPPRGLGHREDSQWDPGFRITAAGALSALPVLAPGIKVGREEREVGKPAGDLATYPMIPHPFLPWQLW